MQHVAIVRSPLAHGRVVRIDCEAALAMDGVVGVVTGADVAELSRPIPAVIQSPIDYFAAAVDVVRYVGEPVAVVVARDRYIAEDTAELVEVDYEPLDPILDPLAVDDPVSDRSFSYGDPEEAMARADLVVRQRFTFPRWSAAPVECYGIVADWDSANGSLTTWANFQGPFTLHSVTAAALGLPGAKLRLITPPDSGGSFGVKAGLFPYIVLLGAVSRRLGVPVRWTDFRVAADDVTLGLPEITIGMIPGSGGTQRLSRLIGLGRAKNMIMRGRRIGAAEALQLGVVTEVVPLDELDAAAGALAEELMALSPLALRMAKRVLDHAYNAPLSVGLDVEGLAYGFLRTSDDFREGVEAFVDKRPADYTGQ
ncbi:MAG: enoyl-CoA hydratase-related protein [Acidimicrobiia bacterium]|nr:enoyl-CoA hydratase-related protein [Acidimicrobiia bacterium]